MRLSNKVSGTFWVSLYYFLVITPLIILLAGPKFSNRPSLLDLSDSLAFVGLAVMATQFILTARIKEINKPFGTDIIYYFHRQIGIAAFFLVFSHPILLFILDTRYIRYLNVFSTLLRYQLGLGAILLLIAVAVLAEYREKLKLPYWWWKLWHGIFASFLIPFALYHIFTGGNYIDLPWEKGLWILYSVIFTLIVIYTRVIYPLKLIRNPYQIDQVKQERGNVFTLTMKPVNHKGFFFMPGQFAWITAWQTPFSDSEHPFSIASSSEEKNSIQMSIKKQGKFTSNIPSLVPGDRVFIDGPYGYFSMDRYPGTEQLCFIAGGIGITPIMSMLRSMVDRKDKRRVIFFCCNQEWDTLTFREEIEDLPKKLNLKLIYVIERPPQEWQGEKGFLNTSILKKYLTPEWISGNTEVFLCGPAPMMNAVEKALLATGFNEKNVHTERFALV